MGFISSMTLVLGRVYTAFEAGAEIDLEFSNASGVYHKGKAIITSISEEAGQDDVVSYTMSFEGTGALNSTRE